MKKNFLFGFSIGLVAVAAAVMALLRAIPATAAAMEWFTLGYAVVIVAGWLGVAFILRGLFGSLSAPLKKLSIYFGATFALVAIVALIGELAIKSDKLVLPIIAVVVTVALLLGYIAVGGKKWDAGDNQKPGYKNYYERKAAEEKKEKEDNSDKEDKEE